jgi:hypothetical protein
LYFCPGYLQAGGETSIVTETIKLQDVRLPPIAENQFVSRTLSSTERSESDRRYNSASKVDYKNTLENDFTKKYHSAQYTRKRCTDSVRRDSLAVSENITLQETKYDAFDRSYESDATQQLLKDASERQCEYNNFTDNFIDYSNCDRRGHNENAEAVLNSGSDGVLFRNDVDHVRVIDEPVGGKVTEIDSLLPAGCQTDGQSNEANGKSESHEHQETAKIQPDDNATPEMITYRIKETSRKEENDLRLSHVDEMSDLQSSRLQLLEMERITTPDKKQQTREAVGGNEIKNELSSRSEATSSMESETHKKPTGNEKEARNTNEINILSDVMNNNSVERGKLACHANHQRDSSHEKENEGNESVITIEAEKSIAALQSVHKTPQEKTLTEVSERHSVSFRARMTVSERNSMQKLTPTLQQDEVLAIQPSLGSGTLAKDVGLPQNAESVDAGKYDVNETNDVKTGNGKKAVIRYLPAKRTKEANSEDPIIAKLDRILDKDLRSFQSLTNDDDNDYDDVIDEQTMTDLLRGRQAKELDDFLNS